MVPHMGQSAGSSGCCGKDDVNRAATSRFLCPRYCSVEEICRGFPICVVILEGAVSQVVGEDARWRIALCTVCREVRVTGADAVHVSQSSDDGESQAQKRAAAEAYAFNEDSRWIDYWNNVLIPPQMSARSEVRRHFQLKFYQRVIDPELEVQPLSSLSESSKDNSAPARPSVSTQQRPASTRGSTAQSTAGSIPPRPPPRAAPPVNRSFRLDQKSFQFLNNGWIVVMAILAVFPLPLGGISDRGYRFSLAGSAFACAHCLYLNNGRPRTWNLQGFQQWMQTIVPSKDFLSLLYSIIFLTSFHPVMFAVVPVLCRSLEQAGMYLRANFSNTQIYKRFLQRPCDLLAINRTKLQLASANAEIGIGFMSIFMILTPQRNIVQALMYWQLLKLYYKAPSTSMYHQHTWARIGARVNPLIHRFAPILQRPLDYVRNWFLN